MHIQTVLMNLDMNHKLIVNVAIDDCNPLKGYRILGEKPEKWLRELNERYGCKFDLFCPSNFHSRAPLHENKEWVNELLTIDYFNLNAHGHYHQTLNPKLYGECEWFELEKISEIHERMDMMFNEWGTVGINLHEIGWRNPGWLVSNNAKESLEVTFKYAAIHYEHNQGMNWKCKTFFGHDGIQQENIGIHNWDYSDPENPIGMVMFQSHICGNHNHNVWNEANFEQLCLSLDHLTNHYNCTFKTLQECL